MYLPSILDAPLVPTGPADPARPDQALTFLRPFVEGELEVGVWECTPGSFDGTSGDFDEIMFMVSGRASIAYGDSAGTTQSADIAPGTLWVTPRNWPCTWTVHQTLRKMYVIDHRPGAAGEAVFLPNAYAAPVGERSPRANPIEGEPAEASHEIWSTNGIDAGVWECTPGIFPFRRDGWSEIVTILSGSATLVIDGGVRLDLTAGSVYYTPAGLRGHWEVRETVRKAFGIIRH
jgi:uncharacterized cupin superfamily protein